MTVVNSFRNVSRRVVLLAAWCVAMVNADAVRTMDLRCEMLRNPVAVDNLTPALSWKLPVDHMGIRQVAYQILAASRPDWLNEKQADLWNSGRVESEESIWRLYAGQPLASRSQVWWTVRVWDERGDVSAWAPSAHFGVGLLEPSDWTGRYIAAERKDWAENPLMHRTFEVDNPKALTLIHVNALGMFEVYVNNRKVSEDLMAPAVVEYPKRSLSVSYDVTPYLRKGRNDIVLWLSTGWYAEGAPGVVSGGPFVRAQVEQRNGTEWTTLVQTDATWQTRGSGTYMPGNWAKENHNGEVVRASEMLPDFTAQTLDTCRWKAALVPDVPIRTTSPMMCEPNRICQTLRPAAISRAADGAWMIDMGRSVAGWVDMKFHGLRPGQTVRLAYSDMLRLDGEFDTSAFDDRYVAAGTGGEERFVNRFNYHAFRYIKVYGLDGPPSYDDLTAYLIHTAYEDRSSFVSSDADMNAIHDMVHYTFPCLTMNGYMVDCPHMERKGYGGDGNASILAAQMMYDLYPLYNNWLQGYADAQGDDGFVPHIGPCPSRCGGGPYWCAFMTNAPWQTFLQYGDRRLLERYWPNMERFVAFAERHMPNGLLTVDTRWPNTEKGWWFLGDWALPNEDYQRDERSASLVASCVMSWIYDLMTQIARETGRTSQAQLYADKHERINERIHQTFFNKKSNTYAAGVQLDMAFPLFVGATPASLVTAVNRAIQTETERRFDGHFVTGLVGIPILTQWLTRSGDVQFVYDILKKRAFPGYLYMIDNNATTTWEHWAARRSRIHNCYNGIGSWFYEALAGVRVDPAKPAYRHILISPQVPRGMDYVRMSKPTPYGQLGVEWNKYPGKLEMKVQVPASTTATVTIPFRFTRCDMPSAGINRGGAIFDERFVGQNTQEEIPTLPGNQPVELSAGTYRLVFYLDEK